jgi:hypothetical protein
MDKMNLKELKAYAKQKGIKGYSKFRKDELREFIKSQTNKKIDRIKILSSTPLETIYDDMTYYAIMDRGRGSYDTFVEKREKDEPNYYMKFREYEELIKMVQGKDYSDKSIRRIMTKQRKEKAKSRIRREGWTMNNPSDPKHGGLIAFSIYRKPKKFKKYLMDDSDSD